MWRASNQHERTETAKSARWRPSRVPSTTTCILRSDFHKQHHYPTRVHIYTSPSGSVFLVRGTLTSHQQDRPALATGLAALIVCKWMGVRRLYPYGPNRKRPVYFSAGRQRRSDFSPEGGQRGGIASIRMMYRFSRGMGLTLAFIHASLKASLTATPNAQGTGALTPLQPFSLNARNTRRNNSRIHTRWGPQTPSKVPPSTKL